MRSPAFWRFRLHPSKSHHETHIEIQSDILEKMFKGSHPPSGNHFIVDFDRADNFYSTFVCLIPHSTVLGLWIQHLNYHAYLLSTKPVYCQCFHYLCSILHLGVLLHMYEALFEETGQQLKAGNEQSVIFRVFTFLL